MGSLNLVYVKLWCLKKNPCRSLHFCWQAKLCFAKSEWSITMQSEVKTPSPHHSLSPLIPVPASLPFSSFSPVWLLGPGRAECYVPLIKSSLSVTLACLKPASWGRWARGGGERGLRSQEASPHKTEKSPGIPPPLMRSIPIRRSPQAASTRWNARPLSLIALLRAISASLSDWLTAELYQLGDSWYVCYCQSLLKIALLFTQWLLFMQCRCIFSLCVVSVRQRCAVTTQDNKEFKPP